LQIDINSDRGDDDTPLRNVTRHYFSIAAAPCLLLMRKVNYLYLQNTKALCVTRDMVLHGGAVFIVVVHGNKYHLLIRFKGKYLPRD